MPNALRHDPHVLHSARDYQAAMAIIHDLLAQNPAKGTREHRQLELYTLLAEDYETRTEPELPVPSPQRMVEFMLKQHGLTRADLAEHMGGKARVSEFFAGKRELSVNQLKALRDLFHVPADLFMPPAVKAAAPRHRVKKTA